QFINGVRPFGRLSPASPISPNTGLTNITQRESGGNANYNGLWLTANKRFARGLSFSTSYTFSKSIDYNSGNASGTVVQDSFNLQMRAFGPVVSIVLNPQFHAIESAR